MAQTSLSDTSGIDFAAMMNAPVAEPEAGTQLAKVARTGELQTYSARADLSDQQRAQLVEVSQHMLPQILEDRAQLSSLGIGVLAKSNELSSQIIKRNADMDVPEVEGPIRDMEHAVSKFRRKYDSANPKVIEVFTNIRRFMSGASDLAIVGARFFEDMRNDTKDVVERLDQIAARVTRSRTQLLENAAYCEAMIADGAEVSTSFISFIALMEQLHEDATARFSELAAQAESHPVGSPKRTRLEGERDDVKELISQLEGRNNEFVTQLFTCYAMTRQVRNLRRVSIGLAERLNLLVFLTIPALKRHTAALIMLKKSEQAGKQIEAIDRATNSALQDGAALAGQVIPQLERQIQTPSVSAETIGAITQSIIDQDNGILEAWKVGRQERAIVVDSIVTGLQRVASNDEQTREELMQFLQESERPLTPLEAPQVPEVILSEPNA